jgi:hypothetical protein
MPVFSFVFCLIMNMVTAQAYLVFIILFQSLAVTKEDY